MKPRNILILCTGNSARSIIGEVLTSAMPGFKGYSAGSRPREEPHPIALAILEANGHDTSGLSSKSWDVFEGPDAPVMDMVITLCDNAASETCPTWPGHPVQVQWALQDPLHVEEMAQRRAAFEDTYSSLKKRLQRLAALNFDELSPAELKAAAQDIHTKR